MTPLHWNLHEDIVRIQDGSVETTADRASRIKESEELFARLTEEMSQVIDTPSNYKKASRARQKLVKEMLASLAALCE